MDEARTVNKVELRGTLADGPAFSHESRGEIFYQFSMDISRLSKTVDTVNIVARKNMLDALELNESSKIAITGELRSFNNKSGRGSKLVITVFAHTIFFDDGDDENNIWLYGTLCKPPSLRTTPMGRDICDMMLAVNRRYGRSDYIPCIAWGLRAKNASELSVGACISLRGRLQSRKYLKNIDGETIEKIAYEVSVTELDGE